MLAIHIIQNKIKLLKWRPIKKSLRFSLDFPSQRPKFTNRGTKCSSLG